MGAIRAGWQTFKRRKWFFVGVTALMMIISWMIGAIAGALGEDGGLALLGVLLNIGLSTLLSMGFAAVMLRSYDTVESAELGELWHPKPFWKFLAAQILIGISVVIGLVLLIVPGIILMLMFILTPYIIVDRELAPIAAMKESARITKGRKWELLLFVLIAFVLNLVGAIALLVGLLVSIPVTTLALVHAYRELAKSAGAPATVPPPAATPAS